jgi:hypothetical protein
LRVAAPGATTSTRLTWAGSELVAIGGKVALLPIQLGTADFLVHHIHEQFSTITNTKQKIRIRNKKVQNKKEPSNYF